MEHAKVHLCRHWLRDYALDCLLWCHGPVGRGFDTCYAVTVSLRVRQFRGEHTPPMDCDPRHSLIYFFPRLDLAFRLVFRDPVRRSCSGLALARCVYIVITFRSGPNVTRQQRLAEPCIPPPRARAPCESSARGVATLEQDRADGAKHVHGCAWTLGALGAHGDVRPHSRSSGT